MFLIYNMREKNELEMQDSLKHEYFEFKIEFFCLETIHGMVLVFVSVWPPALACLTRLAITLNFIFSLSLVEIHKKPVDA